MQILFKIYKYLILTRFFHTRFQFQQLNNNYRCYFELVIKLKKIGAMHQEYKERMNYVNDKQKNFIYERIF